MKRTNQLRRRRRVTLAAISTISTGGLLAMAGSAVAAPINTNLVVNGTFENVNLQSTGAYNGPQILNWSGMTAFAYSHDGSSSSTGVVPNYADGAPPPGAGHWYFTSNNAGVTNIEAPGQFFQDIDVSSGATAPLVASGTARYNLSAFMSSYLNDNDFGNAHIDFLNSSGGSLGVALLSDSDPGPNNVWNLNSLSGLVPVGTATMRLSVFGTPLTFGADGYIDNVELSITAVPEPAALGIAGGGLFVLTLIRKRRRDGP